MLCCAGPSLIEIAPVRGRSRRTFPLCTGQPVVRRALRMAPAVLASAHAQPCARLASSGQGRHQSTAAAVWRPFSAPQQPQRQQGRQAAGRLRRCRQPPTQALFGGLANVFKNDPAERTRKNYQARVDQINALEPSMKQLSDAQLREMTTALKKRAAAGEPLDSLLVESFAVS